MPIGLRIPRGFQKPPMGALLNPAHPFCEGLSFVVPFNDVGVAGSIADGDTTSPSFVGSILNVGAPHNTTCTHGGATNPWWTSNREGRCIAHPISVGQTVISPKALYMTSAVTICFVRRKRDTTNRFAAVCGTGNSDGEYLVIRCPYIDGKIYSNFGLVANEVSVSGVPFTTDIERYVFTDGPRGTRIFRNGETIFANSTARVRSTNFASSFYIGNTPALTQADAEEFNWFQVSSTQWSDELCRWWTLEPYAHLYAPAAQRRYFWFGVEPPPPGVFTVTLDGADITGAIRLGEDFQIPQLDFQRGQPGSFHFDLETDTKPSAGLEVIAWNKTGTVRVFGGVVETAVPIVFPPGVPKCYRVEALKFDRMFDYFYWSKRYESAVTPLQILRDMWAEKDIESEYGLVLDETVAEGDPIAASPESPLEWKNAKGAQVIKDVEDYCTAAEDPRVGVTSPRKKFSLLTPGTVPAPVTIRTSDVNFSAIRMTPGRRPANTVIGEFGAAGQGGTFIPIQWTTDGVKTAFSVNEIPNIPSSDDPYNEAIVDGTPIPMWPAGHAPGGDGIEWDPSLNGGSIVFVGSAVSLVASPGLIVSTFYRPRYPFTITVGSGTPRIEALIKDDKVEHYAQGYLEASAALAKLGGDPNIFEIDTLEDGLDMYQLLPFDVPEADADDTEGIITGLRAVLNSADDTIDGSFWEYTATVEETGGDPLQVDQTTRYRQALRSVI